MSDNDIRDTAADFEADTAAEGAQGAEAAQQAAADAAPNETSIGLDSPDADKLAQDGANATGGVVDTGNPA